MSRYLKLFLVACFCAVFLSTLTFAFKPGIHEDITETVLRAGGFDVDSARKQKRYCCASPGPNRVVKWRRAGSVHHVESGTALHQRLDPSNPA